MRKIIALLLIAAFVLCFAGCDFAKQEDETVEEQRSMFVVVEHGASYRVVYHRDTKVMYVYSCSSYNCGNFTLMVDADGNPLLWTGGDGQ